MSLARQALAVDAFDVSPVGVAKARTLAADTGVAVNFHVCDCDAWNWQAEPTIWWRPSSCSSRIRPCARACSATCSSLRPGGYLILQGYTPKQLEFNTGGPGGLDHLYTEDKLRDAFCGLEILALRAWEEELHEGKRHNGPSALVGMVTQRPVR